MNALDELIAAAREIEMTPEQEAEQRRSFAFGNCNIENPMVTREMVDEADRRLHPPRQLHRAVREALESE